MTDRKSTAREQTGRHEMMTKQSTAGTRGVVSVRRPTLSLKPPAADPSAESAAAQPPVPPPAPRPLGPMRESVQLPWDRPFFFVWSPSEGRPQRRHATAGSAATEAARLGALYPAKQFLIFRAELLDPAQEQGP